MQQAVNHSQRANTLLAIAKALSDPYQSLTPQQEAALAALIPGHVKGGEVGLPSAPAGDVRGRNALLRANWFNGRYLTAEALRRQDVYNDLRDRLGAHAQMPGVAWGLGLHPGDGQNALPVVAKEGEGAPREGGMAKWMRITLRPGLAFDHVGRPILVSQPFDFTLEDLIGPARNTPLRVVPGGTEFAPCVCLAPDPEGPSGGSAMLRPGPWLLVIEPGETAEGQAKVMGEACAGPSTANCQAESWRGGFGLSLVRVPIELPEGPGLDTAWALRGTMSAWWFDVFEHSLIKRWDPAFATDAGFWRGAGPGRQEAGAVALAMVWLGTDGSAIFLDPWIPRRSIVATPGEDWHRTRFGAPPRAAAWARIHQFQAMLAESLRAEPLMGAGNRETPRLNIWHRGFRHIPPIGFLPIDPAAFQGRFPDHSSGLPALDRLVLGRVEHGFKRLPMLAKAAAEAEAQGALVFVSNLITGAREQAFTYFAGTTVLPYCVVALHDDDILEDLANVFDKDPVQVALRARALEQAQPSPWDQGGTPSQSRLKDTDVGVTVLPEIGYVDDLGHAFETLGLDDVVNRRVEVVKVIIPMQGLTRAHPILGAVSADAGPQLADWLGEAAGRAAQRRGLAMDIRGMSGLASRLPVEMLPRHFAVYVKQRLVLLDLLFALLEVLQTIVLLLRDVRRTAYGLQKTQAMPVTTGAYQQAWQAQPAEKRAMAEAVLADPLVRKTMVGVAVRSSADLRVPARNEAFASALEKTEASLAAVEADPTLRQRRALALVADAYAAEYPGFGIVQILSAIQPPAQAAGMLADLRLQAAQAPLRDLSGTIAGGTVADRVAGEVTVFDTATGSLAYGALRGAIAEKPASAFLADAPVDLTVASVLAKPEAEAARLLGGEDKLAAFTEALVKERAAAMEAATTLAAAPPSAALLARIEEAIAQGQDAAAVLQRAGAAAASPSEKASLSAAARVVSKLGAERTLALSRSFLRPG